MNILNMFKNDKNLQNEINDEIIVARFPVLLWVSLVYAASVILQVVYGLNWVNTLIFTLCYIVHLYLHWNLYKIPKTKVWIFF